MIWLRGNVKEVSRKAEAQMWCLGRTKSIATNANAWKTEIRISSKHNIFERARIENHQEVRSDHITEHSPSCLCAGTPISSKVFGPLPGFAVGGFATALAGFGVVEGEGSAGPSVKVTGFLPGTSAGPGGGREAGREEGAEVRPCGRSKAGIELELWRAGDPGGP
jgi:hypothetical protein